MKRKHQRLVLVCAALTGLGIATALALVALEDNIVFFQSPSDVLAKGIPIGQEFRIGGLVVEESLESLGDDGVAFVVTDMAETIRVVYRGVLPDMVIEGQGVVAQGALRGDGVFVATTVLAKHDENYMPAEVTQALKDAGHWQEESGE